MIIPIEYTDIHSFIITVYSMVCQYILHYYMIACDYKNSVSALSEYTMLIHLIPMDFDYDAINIYIYVTWLL